MLDNDSFKQLTKKLTIIDTRPTAQDGSFSLIQVLSKDRIGLLMRTV